ncbi:MAG: hypothetical protein ABIK09_11140 [Pseudomonadota bacterium]
MRTTLVGWKNGPWIRPAALWLDAPPVGRGLRFVSSCLARAGRRPDRVLATPFTGRYHFGADRPFLTAPEGEPIRLGAAEVRLLPAGVTHGAAQLHFRSDDGTLLYTVGRRLSGTSLAPAARLVPADIWLLRMDAPPGDGPPWLRWMEMLSEHVRGGAVRALRVAHPWLGAELSAGLDGGDGGAPRLDVQARRMLRWNRAGGPLAADAEGPRILFGDAGPEEVILVGDRGEESIPVPGAPTLLEIREALEMVGAREVLFTGAGAPSWANAMAGIGLPARILGVGPRRLL